MQTAQVANMQEVVKAFGKYTTKIDRYKWKTQDATCPSH